MTLAQAGLATAKGESEAEPRISGAGQLSASSTTYQFSLDLRLNSSGDLKGSFSLQEVGAPKSERFTLEEIISLELSDDQGAGDPCSGITECDADWNTADLTGTGKLGSTDGHAVTLTAVDGGSDASSDRLIVEIRDSLNALVLSITGTPTLGTGLRVRNLLSLPTAGSYIVQDHFEDTGGTPLESHAANVDFLGRGWNEQAYREWFIESNEVSNLAGAQSPFYAISDAGLINVEIKADVTWTVGEVGLLFRYQDKENHWQFIYDGGKKLLLRKIEGGVTTTFPSLNFEWGKAGKVRELSVTLEDGDIVAKVGNSKKFDITDTTHQGQTRHGLYFQLQETASIDNFTVASLGGTPGAPPPIPPLPNIADSLVFDTFTEGSVISLTSHTPEKDTIGNGWKTGTGGIGSGSWTAGTSTATEIDGAAADVHAIIDTGSADIDIRVDITWDDPASKPGGVGLAGLVIRYEDESNWTKVWFDGVTELVLAEAVGGSFKELRRVSVDWRQGETHRLRVKRNGDSIRVYEDTDSLLMLRIETKHATSTKIGLFAHNLDTSTFDNFVVTASADLPEPDPDPPPVDPTPTPTPTPPAAPADADFYDSFTG
ncbi:MAG: hypothetical protein IH961_03500, partial [Chloroflexi bacterium]|nr:hypothetical protein [Chloroflexota bacterium]